jgi:hypothetical protein
LEDERKINVGVFWLFFDIGFLKLYFRHWIFDIGFSTLDFRHWIFDIGFPSVFFIPVITFSVIGLLSIKVGDKLLIWNKDKSFLRQKENKHKSN